jgi:regulator of sigma E protease
MQGEDEEDQEGEDIEKSFNSKSVWARMSIILAGPIFNFLLALFLSVIVIGFVGYDSPSIVEVKEGTPAYEAGLRSGDIITEYNGNTIFFSRELSFEEYIHPMGTDTVTIEYKRDGEKETVQITPKEVSWYAAGMSYYVNEESGAKN